MNIKCVTVIGLGLIGGSIAKALKERCGIDKIIGIDNNDNTLQQAIDEGIISVALNDVSTEMHQSDIVFVCTPVNKTIEWIQKAASVVPHHCIITDVGSTKAHLINQVEKLPEMFHFIGGHPMAGSEQSGYMSSKSHLFENAYYIISPCEKSTHDDIQILKELAECFGSIPIEIPPELHDKVTGAISHVPHIISAALVNMVKDLDTSGQYMQKLAAGGFKDITRIASSNPEMWHNICFSNKDAILDILDVYLGLLNTYKTYIETLNGHEVFQFFADAKEFRDSFPSKVTGLIPGTYELSVDVVDKPGIIGEVATILGKNDINIKNINISNSREYEGGVLIISLPNRVSMDKSYEILIKYGYHAIKRH
ncbi:prephenate dehydrogenase [Petroclostridium sp. X23]|uniref:prephenate dehydrogenase n=1 Tax=Petroclostridium sp. X23 TaxID=3045146 RepID=UPI0024AE3552|nr:prephenate dehydrogenase [Petroclostridium sp. X23]WHH56894.1 prephenate dehydrogenase [Petroclostridium sp. X23]